MKNRVVGIALLAIFVAVPVYSQDTALRSAAGDKWVITAKAGGVNFLQGSVTVTRDSDKTGLLLKGDSIEVGDKVSTGADGRVEILLNPGSYLRVAENSTFEFKTTELEDLQLTVHRGAVMLEVFAANDFKVAVSAPNQKYDLVDSGVYRVDVDAQGNARIEVWKGKAEVGDTTLKGGKTASSLDGQVAVAKFDRDDRDDFEIWSRDRAKELAKGTDSLRDRTLRTSLMRSFLGGRWNMYDSFGLWVFDARFGRYCFLPFGYGWSSPYGFGFGTDIWWYRLPRAVYYPPPTTRGPVAGNPRTGGTTTPTTPPSGGGTPREGTPIVTTRRQNQGRVDRSAPPFTRMQGAGRSTGRDSGGFESTPRRTSGGDFGRGTPRSAPASSAPVSIPRNSSPISRGSSPIRGKGEPLL